ncbi:MAG: acetoacetate decarboxylase family protein [Actinomycetota bacterium]
MSEVANFTIQGRTLALPVEVRAARSWAATFVVPTAAAQTIVGPTGLEVAQMRKGRSIASLAFVRYEDTDLGAYDEVAVAFVVRRHDARAASAARKALEVARNQTGVYIHHLPVNHGVTLEAGRTIWGYPKFMAEIDIAEQPRATTCTLRHDGSLVLSLTIRAGVRPWPRVPNLPTYTFFDGVLRRTPWETTPMGTRGRVGGAALELGSHAIADELRSLGLPRRALVSTSVERISARFGAAEVVHPTVAAASR